MVLLVRGDLLRRYPRAIVYALESVWSADGTRRELGTTERYPIFRATQSPDITMLGFPLTETEVRGADNKAAGHPGWFFVLQEQPTEPRFGMDVAKTYGGTPQHWSDLTWGHLAPDEAGLKQIVYVPIDGLLKNCGRRPDSHGEKIPRTWRRSRSQPPFRVAVHAQDLAAGTGTATVTPTDGKRRHHALLETRYDSTADRTPGSDRTTGASQRATRDTTTGGDCRAGPTHDAANAVAQAQARIPPLQAAAAAADAQVAEVEQELQDAAEPPAGIPPATWRVRLTALRKKLALAKTAATAAHAKVAEAQQGVTQAQAQVQAADRQVAAAAAAVQATQTAIAALQTRQRDVQQRLAVLDRWEADIARDPLTRPSLEQTAAELSAQVAKLEDAHLAARFELEDAEALLASLTATTRRVHGHTQRRRRPTAGGAGATGCGPAGPCGRRRRNRDASARRTVGGEPAELHLQLAGLFSILPT